MFGPRCFFFGAFLSFVQLAAAADSAKTISLFDGHSLNGWQSTSKIPTLVSIWKAHDGIITCQGSPNGYLRTTASFENYALHVEWRWPEKSGNSGIFLHITGEDKVWPLCLEIQVKVGQSGNVNANGGAQFAELEGAKHFFPHHAADSEKPMGDWNVAEIVCRADTVTVTINGVRQNEITHSTVVKGPIGLQAEGAPIEFRHLTVTPLSPASP